MLQALLTTSALPVLESLAECADLNKTVTPFIPQLYDLPQRLFEARASAASLQHLYLATNPLVSGFAFSIVISAIVFVVSEFNRNYSQVDRLWSLLPTIYNAHYYTFAYLSGLRTQRLDCLLACSVLWSARLTFNYWRKGGYNVGSEDYRWEILKDWVKPYDYGLFFVFNALFISAYQNVLLWFIATPGYILLLSSKFEGAILPSDLIATTALVGLVTIEWFADQQQWDFQTAKQKYLKTAKAPYRFEPIDLDRGFIVTGLWTYSRHPNFAAEQSIWIVMYLWSCAVTGVPFNWTGVGAAALVSLFQGSTWLTELITAGKYEDYKEYQARVGKFLPNLFSRRPGDFSDRTENTKPLKKSTKALRK